MLHRVIYVGNGAIVNVPVSVPVNVTVEEASGVVTMIAIVVVEVTDKIVVGVAAVTVVVLEAVFVKVVGMKLSTTLRQVTTAGQLEGELAPGIGHSPAGEDLGVVARACTLGSKDRLFLFAWLPGKVSRTGEKPAGVGTVVVPEALVVVVLVEVEVFITVCVVKVIVFVSVVIEVAVNTSVD